MISIQDAAVPEIVSSHVKSGSSGNGSPNGDDNDMWRSLDELIGPSNEVCHMAILRDNQFGDVTLNIGGGAAQTDDEHSRCGNEGDREIQMDATDIADLLTMSTAPSSELDEAEVAETPAKTIVINSDLAAIYSPVFRAMLRTNFAESKVNNSRDNWVVNLPDDNVEPLFFVLSMIHGRWENIPAKISVDELHDLLLTADKYDMMRIFLPWYLHWTASYQFLEWRPWDWCVMSLPHVDLLLWIAWETRMRADFETIMFRMSYWYRVNDKGELLGFDGLPLQLRGTWNTDEVMKTISQWRQRGVDYVHHIFHEDITRDIQHSACTRYMYRTCKASCVETIVHIYNAVGIGSAPMLRAHTGNLADLVRIMWDVGEKVLQSPHCDNVRDNIFRVEEEFQLEVDNYMWGLVTLAGRNNSRPFRRRVPPSDGCIGRE
ncbi:hypothetical protein GCG54_00005724 [Colletotrichum gloeosporioides]|uniref:BTB domain-containing protein n=1 Tax=Colletotrichum gloeosporioides TaxID=474922 RepID=A0A8H4FL66_COLGL|nr:uncharacterized protein GCG54_00005724 [Colletotrichum gloeosporioides]KAF3804979.1 hypothetical protein GCG54_00005724 [Colletotrichum gloeosporioides]